MYKMHSFAENICKGVILLSNKKKKPSPNADRVKHIISMKSAETDPNGSYTGVPENPFEKPVQDADDL